MIDPTELKKLVDESEQNNIDGNIARRNLALKASDLARAYIAACEMADALEYDQAKNRRIALAVKAKLVAFRKAQETQQ